MTEGEMGSVITTGLNGLVGSKFDQLFRSQYHFDCMDSSSKDNPVDITNYDQVLRVFLNSSAKSVIHLAAYTNVTGAWEQSGDKTGPAYLVNVEGTRNIVNACKETGKHLIHISTAYVFNGENEGLYLESDPVSPIEWYGQTKAWAEEVVANSDIPWTIFRIDQPFRSDSFAKVDAVHRIINGLKDGTLYPQFTDHFFGPTFIDDFAKVLDWSVRTRKTGLFHASSGEKWSDYDFSSLINEVHQLGSEVKPGLLEDYLKTLTRPYQRNTAMNNQKLKTVLDFPLLSIKEAIKLVK
jgi:dTDP-4-dehydrorhamnose reductase